MGTPSRQPRHLLPLGSAGARAVGALLILPAMIMLMVHMVWPSIRTVRESFSDGNFFDKTPEFVGLRNYGEAVVQLGSSVGFGLVIVVLPWLISVVLGLGIALSSRGSQQVATLGRALTGVVMALFLPVVAYAGLVRSADGRPGGMLALVISGLVMGTAGATGLQALLFSAVLRRSRPATGVLVVSALGAMTAMALSLQVFIPGFVGGGFGRHYLPAVELYRTGFGRMALGQATAMSTLIGLVLGGLGLGAVAMILATRTGFSVVEPRSEAPRSGLGVVGLIAGVLAVVGGVLALVPAFGAADLPPLLGMDVGKAQLRMWLGSAWLGFLQLIIAGLAGLGIGWCRPLGEQSRWLLLIFAPWLFVGAVPLMLGRYVIMVDHQTVDGPFTDAALILSVPMVVAFTLLADGLRSQQAIGQGKLPAGTARIVYSAIGLIFGIGWVTTAHNVVWPLVTVPEAERWPASLLALQMMGGQGAGGAGVLGLVEPVWLLIMLVLISAAVQVFGFGRLALGPVRPQAQPVPTNSGPHYQAGPHYQPGMQAHPTQAPSWTPTPPPGPPR